MKEQHEPVETRFCELCVIRRGGIGTMIMPNAAVGIVAEAFEHRSFKGHAACSGCVEFYDVTIIDFPEENDLPTWEEFVTTYADSINASIRTLRAHDYERHVDVIVEAVEYWKTENFAVDVGHIRMLLNSQLQVGVPLPDAFVRLLNGIMIQAQSNYAQGLYEGKIR